MTNPNRELAEDAAGFSYLRVLDRIVTNEFADGFELFMMGKPEPDKVHLELWQGYIAARDAPE